MSYCMLDLGLSTYLTVCTRYSIGLLPFLCLSLNVCLSVLFSVCAGRETLFEEVGGSVKIHTFVFDLIFIKV
jgi:hypothetical protein